MGNVVSCVVGKESDSIYPPNKHTLSINSQLWRKKKQDIYVTYAPGYTIPELPDEV